MASTIQRATTPAHQPESGNPSTQVPEPIAEQDFDDHDSAIDSASVYTDTTSLASSVTKYRTENGRRYHAYGSTEHWGPNDESAQDQQDLSHHLWTLTLNGGLYLAPIAQPQNVLDLGTGTGIWAIDIADAHPAAAVKGIDLSPIQPAWVPTNLKFEVDDYNLEWLDEDKYDLIHARELLGSVPNWPEMYRKIYSGLKPGGWIDQAEPGLFLISDYDTLGSDHVYHQWGQLMVDAGKRSGMDFDIGPRLKGWMEEAGFINVTEVRVPWPVGRWAKDARQRQIGMFNQARLDQGITDFCSRRFANNLGWGKEEIDIFGAMMRSAINNSRLLAHQWVYFVYGQKPPLPA